MKKVILLSAATLLFASNLSARGMMTIISVWFEIPTQNASNSWLKPIAKPTPDKPKSMPNSIYFEEHKITVINKNGVVFEYIGETEKNLSDIMEPSEEARTWKIPDPKAKPKDENDFVATLQIFRKGIVLTFKAGSELSKNVMLFKLKE